MALFLRQDVPRSELQERIAAELREKMKTAQGGNEPADLSVAHDHHTRHTTRGAGVLITLLMLALLGAIIWWSMLSR